MNNIIFSRVKYFGLILFFISSLYSQIPKSPVDMDISESLFKADYQISNFISPSKPGPEHVFVVYNTNSLYGDSIASYYKNIRHIPSQNICPIQCDTNEVISRDYYETSIKSVLRDSLNQRALKEQIRFIVLTKGIPLKISETDNGSDFFSVMDNSSVDSDLCLLFNDTYSIGNRIDNPYFGEIHYFESFTYPTYSESKISYLVSRLDAFSITDVIAMIDRAVHPDTTGTSWYLLDDYPSHTYDKMYDSQSILSYLGMNVIYDNTTTSVSENPNGDVIGYCGHGVHAGAGYPFILNLSLQLANGALFNSYESYNGWTFNENNRNGNHNLIADFIAIGGTGGIGHVYEPYASAIPHEDILFSRYATGYTLIESAYMSMAYLSWQNVVVGDPLCRLKPEIPSYEYAPFIKIISDDLVNDSNDSRACAWGDFDNDGFDDLIVANYNSINFLYKNNGNGTFSKVHDSPIMRDEGQSLDCAWGDYDNDGLLDLFIGNHTNNFLYKNSLTSGFNRINYSDVEFETASTNFCSWNDLNNDGLLDLFNLHNGQDKYYQYYNNGSTLDKLIEKNIEIPETHYPANGVLGDFDNNGFADLFLIGPSDTNGHKNYLFINNRDSSFSIIPNSPFTSDITTTIGANWIDFDNDNDLDLYLSNSFNRSNYLYSNNGDGSFSSINDILITNDGSNSRSTSWIDFDNDGLLDLFVVNYGQNHILYKNNGNGDYSKLIFVDYGQPSGCAWSDFDNDGDPDLFIANNGKNSLFVNESEGNNWLKVRMHGTKSNAAGIGAKVYLKSNINGIPTWQNREIRTHNGYKTHNSLTAHFGLSDAAIVDTVKVLWPSGNISLQYNVASNQVIDLTETTEIKVAFSSPINYFKEIPKSVEFKDLSIGNIQNWKWYFGDGDSSALQNPKHTYTEFGEFNVTLILNPGDNEKKLIKQRYIIIDLFIKNTELGLPEILFTNSCNWVDYNNDGFDDLFIGTGYSDINYLFKNTGTGNFEYVLNEISTLTFNAFDATWGDYNNDGFSDLFMIDYDSEMKTNFLFKNNGDDSFTQITSGLIISDSGYANSCSWVDYDNDGFLDLFVANQSMNDFLYKGLGNGTFEKIVKGNIVENIYESYNQGWADFDNDGDMDVFITNQDYQDSHFYINNADGTFSHDPSVNMTRASNSCTWGDYNNDGFLDLFFTAWPTKFLYKNNGDGTFSEINEIPTGDDAGQIATWADIDNDGFIDLLVCYTFNASKRMKIYKNNGNASFTSIKYWQITNDNDASSALSVSDYDNDGDIDIFLANRFNPVYINSLKNKNWLKIKCIGVTSNRDAIGAKVKIVSKNNGKYQKQYREISAKTGALSQNSLVVHFGLDEAQIIDSLIINWPSGIRWDTTNVAVNQKLYIWEKEKFPVGLDENWIEIPQKYILMQNYPNPFNPITNIKFGIPKKSDVKIELFNILGQKVKIILNKSMEAGYHTISFDASFLATGLYFYSMRSKNFTQIKKMFLIK